MNIMHILVGSHSALSSLSHHGAGVARVETKSATGSEDGEERGPREEEGCGGGGGREA